MYFNTHFKGTLVNTKLNNFLVRETKCSNSCLEHSKQELLLNSMKRSVMDIKLVISVSVVLNIITFANVLLFIYRDSTLKYVTRVTIAKADCFEFGITKTKRFQFIINEN